MFNLTVLVSGNGSNLQSIIDAIANQQLSAKIIKVIADRPCFALDKADKANIPNSIVNRIANKSNGPDALHNFSKELHTETPIETNLIILAGFLSILQTDFIKNWPNKIINIHPSLLPKYGGKGMWGIKVHQAVIANQETESGCTVHFVDDGIDSGKIILQEKVKVTSSDTPESLQKKISSVEPGTLISAIQMIINQ